MEAGAAGDRTGAPGQPLAPPSVSWTSVGVANCLFLKFPGANFPPMSGLWVVTVPVSTPGSRATGLAAGGPVRPLTETSVHGAFLGVAGLMLLVAAKATLLSTS